MGSPYAKAITAAVVTLLFALFGDNDGKGGMDVETTEAIAVAITTFFVWLVPNGGWRRTRNTPE